LTVDVLFVEPPLVFTMAVLIALLILNSFKIN
jgi:hypothetical protein